MSGLDPLGRRDVRALILRLRDEGRTIFFSSHILSDAETLCTRIAIVAGGRMAATGALSDLLARQIRRWEIVVDDLPEAPGPLGVAAALESVRHVSGRRYAIEAAPQEDPMRVVAAILDRGGRLVSVNPVHETLEELFVRHAAESSGVSRFDPAARDVDPVSSAVQGR
jgi:ABC-2 type transport system ATP-binding protein